MASTIDRVRISAWGRFCRRSRLKASANNDSLTLTRSTAGTGHDGSVGAGQLFYSFCLEDVVPDDHEVRAIASVLDLSWFYGELSPLYPALGRPSIDPVLMSVSHSRLASPLGPILSNAAMSRLNLGQ